MAWGLDWWTPLAVATVTSTAVWAVAVIAGRRLIYLTETITREDLNADQFIGPRARVQVEITQTDGAGKPKAMRFLALPTSEHKLRLLRQVTLGSRP